LYKRLLILFFIGFWTQSITAKSNNYLRATALNANQLQLTFKYKIDNVKNFVIKNGTKVKHVFDIKNGVLPKKKTLKNYHHKSVQAFRLGQYKKDCLRLVIESSLLKKKNYKVKGKKLTIYLSKLRLKGATPPPLHRSHKRKKITKKSPLIVVDAGHGGRDNGASSHGIREKDVTLALAKKLKKELNYLGYRVVMTRTSNKYLSLTQRTDFANAKKASLFISIHTNAAPRYKRRPADSYQGVQVFSVRRKHTRRRDGRIRFRRKRIYSRYISKRMLSQSKRLRSAQLSRHIKRELLASVRKENKVLDKGARKEDFWVLIGGTMPSVLIEAGYLTHKKEGKKLLSSRYQTFVVRGIGKGVDAYFGR